MTEAAPLIASAAPGLAELTGATIGLYLGGIIDVALDTEQVDLLEELIAPDRRRGQPIIDGQLSRGQGLLLARRGELDEAEIAFSEAVAALRSVGNPFALGRALLDHGEALLKLDRSNEATPLLEEARALLLKLRAVPFLARVERALAPIATA
jgi:tetratricopeptide (TPR) repeat protein